MTNQSPTPPDRLDRLEALSETILFAIQQQGQQIRQLAEQQQQTQAGLTTTIADIVSMIGNLTREGNEDRRAIRELQSEVRGLQSENRRILDYLLNQQGGGQLPQGS